jgi:hypothetical protein
MTGVRAVAARETTSYALLANGTVVVWCQRSRLSSNRRSGGRNSECERRPRIQTTISWGSRVILRASPT